MTRQELRVLGALSLPAPVSRVSLVHLPSLYTFAQAVTSFLTYDRSQHIVERQPHWVHRR